VSYWSWLFVAVAYMAGAAFVIRHGARRNRRSCREMLAAHTRTFGTSMLEFSCNFSVRGEDMTPLLTLTGVQVDRSWDAMDERAGCRRLYIEYEPGHYYEHFVPANCTAETFRKAVAYLVDCTRDSNLTPPIYREFS